jgi:hypothetical protein
MHGYEFYRIACAHVPGPVLPAAQPGAAYRAVAGDSDPHYTSTRAFVALQLNFMR